ncbi:retinol dehydrogenase 11-like [Rhodnius prolixus]
MSSLARYIANLTKKISFVLDYILYEIIFCVLGAQSMLEDIILKSKNKCALVNKNGEVAIVTGGSRGIGANLVKKLLQCEMTVIIGCRSVEAGLLTVQQIREEGITQGIAHVYKLDLESMQSVRDFANEIYNKFEFINLIVNNAGVMFTPYRETVDGFETQLAVNYLAPFYLTHLLMPLLNKKEASRVVMVSSCAHIAARAIHFENMNMRKNFITAAAYAQSKLCQILFTAEIDRNLRERNSNVYVLAVHPGIVNTDLFNGTPLKRWFPWILKFICKDVDAGAISVLAPCISSKFNKKGGIYISNCTAKTPSKLGQDIVLQKELLKYSLKVLSISKFGEC